MLFLYTELNLLINIKSDVRNKVSSNLNDFYITVLIFIQSFQIFCVNVPENVGYL